MIIENANLSSLASSSVTVESGSTPLADGSVASNGFSGALVAQIELLSNMKAADSLPVQAQAQVQTQAQDVAALNSVASLPDAKADTQDFAALLGNDLPLSYKTKDDIDHEAALAAVTDTLKYISTDSSAVEKAAAVEQNVKDVIAMIVPSEQDVANVAAAAVPARQDMTNAVAAAVPPVQQSLTNTDAVAVSVEKSIANLVMAPASNEQNVENVAVAAVPLKQSMASVVPVEQSNKNINMTVVPVEQDTADVVVLGADQGKKVIVMDGAAEAAQVDSEQTNNEADKTQVEEAQPVTVKNNREAEGVVATITLPPVMQTEQVTTVNNLTSATVASDGATKTNGVLPFAKPLTGDGSSSQSTKAMGENLQGEMVFGQRATQDKQGFNLNYFQNSGQTEKAGQVDPQALSLDGEKALPRVGADMIQPSRMSDNKTDVPAMTKPLSHPEWNKDLGERIIWMTNKAMPSAEIRLNPQHLGPISVRVDVADDQASVVFTAQHAAVRETLEASIPKLREMMGAQQLNLADVSISQGSASDHGRSQAQNFAQTANGRGQNGEAIIADGIDDMEQEIASGRAVVSNGVLSIYA